MLSPHCISKAKARGNRLKNRVNYVLFALLLTGCNQSSNVLNNAAHSDSARLAGKADSAKTESRIESKQRDTLSLGFGCYYKLDDKYSESKDTSEINAWWREKIKRSELKGIQDNLFSGNGGGPNGAEWNPSTDLFLIATINRPVTDEAITLELNKNKISGIKFLQYIPENKIGTLVCFELPQAVWGKYLRKIKVEDLNGIYGGEKLDTLKKYSAAPLDAGRVIEISLSISNGCKLTGFFHVAYGE